MPTYRVLVSGDGCQREVEGRRQTCAFRVACHVWSNDPAVAANMAVQLVRAAPGIIQVIGDRAAASTPIFVEEIAEVAAEEPLEPIDGIQFY